ncbi:hypothetical protein D3C79_1025460 [compost metagenome]
MASDLALAGLGEKCGVKLTVDDAAGVFFAVEANARVGDVVGDDQIEVLVFQLARSVIEQVFGLGGETDTERAVGAGGDGGQDVRVTHHL